MATDPPSIRLALPADADRLGAISARAWGATYPGIVPAMVLEEWIAGAPAGWHAAFAGQAPGSPWRAWVAERDGAAVGYATTTAARAEWLPPPDGAGELTNLYLDPDVIGTGVGRALYEHAASDLRARGFHPIVVWAFRDNALARRFYDRMGLTVDVPDHAWPLGGVACPIVRYRFDWQPAPEPA